MTNRKKSKKLGIVLMGIVFGLLFYVWQHIQMICLGYRLNELKGQFITLGEQNNMLKKEISRYSNYDKIEEIATSRLHMVYPGPDSIIYLIE